MKSQMYSDRLMILDSRIQQFLNETPVVEYVPDYNPKGYPLQKALYIQGDTYHGRPISAFAYIGYPEVFDTQNSLPAVVLVHGGGGYAFPEWIKKWNDRGYAAIAFCHTGYRPVSGDITEFDKADSWTREDIYDHGWVSGPDNDSMANSDQDFHEQWIYHGVTLTILAQNLLRQEKRVDNTRIGLNGISWGSVIASVVIGYDSRFSFAVPIYGSGFLNEGLGWVQQLFRSEPAKTLWDPGRRIAKVSIPVLWLCWANDPAFSIQPNVRSCAQTPNGEMTIQLNISHGHPEGWNLPEIYRFADAAIRNGEPLVKCITQPPSMWKENRVGFQIQCPHDAENITARLIYLTEPMTYSSSGVIKWDGCNTIDQTWKTVDCQVEKDWVWLDIPEQADSYYVELTSVCGGRHYISSSHYISICRSVVK